MPAKKKKREPRRKDNPFDIFLKPAAQSKTKQSDMNLRKYFNMRKIGILPETAQKRLELSTTWAKQAETELRKAAKKGYTDINKYINDGRPCNAGRQKLA